MAACGVAPVCDPLYSGSIACFYQKIMWMSFMYIWWNTNSNSRNICSYSKIYVQLPYDKKSINSTFIPLHIGLGICRTTLILPIMENIQYILCSMITITYMKEAKKKKKDLDFIFWYEWIFHGGHFCVAFVTMEPVL